MRKSFPFVRAIMASFFTVLLAVACNDDDPDPMDCSGQAVTYTADIKAILDASCAISGCHNSVSMANGYDFSTYATAAPISQGNRFLGAINHQNGFSPMPKNNAKLSDANIQLLTCWVEDGSPE